MNIVTSIMRQHRRIQWLETAIVANPRLRVVMMMELIDAVMLHMACVDGVLGAVRDEGVLREMRAHRPHHDRLRLVLARMAGSDDRRVDSELSILRSLLREHTQHEMLLVQRLRDLGDERLQLLGEQALDAGRGAREAS